MLMPCQGLLDKVEHGLWGALSSGTWLSCIHVNIFFYQLALLCSETVNARLYFSNETSWNSKFFFFFFFREKISISCCSGWAQAPGSRWSSRLLCLQSGGNCPLQVPSSTRALGLPWGGTGGGWVGERQVGNYRVPLHTTGCPDNCYVETCYVWPWTQRHSTATRLLCAYSHVWWWWWGLCSPEVIFRCSNALLLTTETDSPT